MAVDAASACVTRVGRTIIVTEVIRKRSLVAVVLLATASVASGTSVPHAAGAASEPAMIGEGRVSSDGLAGGARNGLVHRVADDGSDKSAAEAARQARREHGGKVLSVTRKGDSDNAHYRVKLLNNGNVRVVRIPAK